MSYFRNALKELLRMERVGKICLGGGEDGREERSRLLNFITEFCLHENNNYTYVLQKFKNISQKW